MLPGMESIRTSNPRAALMSLEAAAVLARGGFACMFSTSDEYESAVIAERRAQGRYAHSHGPWPAVMVVGVALMVAGCAMIWH